MPRAGRAESPAGAGKVVLVVDDEPGVRALARAVLERAGFGVLEAEDGVAALKVMQASQPDLLLTDINMPNMDGHALADAVARRTPGIPVLMMSGYSLNTTARTPVIKGFLAKPFAPRALADAVVRSLR